MGTELIMRLISILLSRVGFAFFLGGLVFSLVMHNSHNYSQLISMTNDFFVHLIYALLGIPQ
jgi:hypothetical protein